MIIFLKCCFVSDFWREFGGLGHCDNQWSKLSIPFLLFCRKTIKRKTDKKLGSVKNKKISSDGRLEIFSVFPHEKMFSK